MRSRLLAFFLVGCSWVMEKEACAQGQSTALRVIAPLVMLQGRKVKVDVYLPKNPQGAPIAILAHGFTREPKYFKGWGQVLAENGILTAIPSLPHAADHAGNGRGLVELLHWLREGGLGKGILPSKKATFLGHSAGGLSAMLAARELGDQVDCWVGLDPVDSRNLGLSAAETLKVPSLMLFAEPGLFNRRCEALKWVPAYGGPLEALHVKGANHGELEKPTSLMSRLFMGGWDEANHSVFEEYALAMLKFAFFGDAESKRRLQLSGGDKRVTVLRSERVRKPK